MKRLVASVGLVALGAFSVQAAPDSAYAADNSKPWSVSATLRGFYDDNVNSTPDNESGRQDSFGFEASPSLSLSIPLETTAITLGYTYSFKYYEEKPSGNVDHYDMSHIFNAALDHSFSSRLKVRVKDSFVIGQEPDTLRAGNTYNTFQRIPGDNIRNYGGITFNAQVTPKFGVELGYDNTFYHYADHGAQTNFFDIVPSHAGTLDRIEHTPHIDGLIQLQPQTTGVIGYRYRQADYIGDEPVAVNYVTGDVLFSEVRNSRSHYGYVGVDHNFRPDLMGSIRVGAQFIDFYNDPTTSSDVSPYAQASLRYAYRPMSYFVFSMTAAPAISSALGART
jgi:hypothetical protein